MDTYYLIDYENVHSDGLAGCDSLTEADHIIIFFTQNAKNIDMVAIANHGRASLEMIEVPAGKQSADIHIGSYLGYLAGSNPGGVCKVVIISKDTDFDNVIAFWSKKAGVQASRAQQIKAPKKASEDAGKKAGKATKKAEGASKKTGGDGKAKDAGESKKKDTGAGKNAGASKKDTGATEAKNADEVLTGKLKQEVIQALRTAKYEKPVAETIAQLVADTWGAEHFPAEVHNKLQAKYTDAQEVYKTIKAVLSKYEKAAKKNVTKVEKSKAPEDAGKKAVKKSAPKKDAEAGKVTGQEKSDVNSEIIQVLVKAGYSNDVATGTASLVVKSLGAQNGKQLVYRGIISQNGQAAGMKIYNLIRKMI